jgi:hypothetical protein
MQTLLIILAALISIGSIKYSGPLRMPTNSAATSGWSIRYSPDMPPSMSQNADGTYYVDLPYQDGLHYVVQGAQGNPTGKTITIRFELVGAGELLASDPGDMCPCFVSLYLQQQGDTLSAADEFKRWWSHKIPLNPQGEASVVYHLRTGRKSLERGAATSRSSFKLRCLTLQMSASLSAADIPLVTVSM